MTTQLTNSRYSHGRQIVIIIDIFGYIRSSVMARRDFENFMQILIGNRWEDFNYFSSYTKNKIPRIIKKIDKFPTRKKKLKRALRKFCRVKNYFSLSPNSIFSSKKSDRKKADF